MKFACLVVASLVLLLAQGMVVTRRNALRSYTDRMMKIAFTPEPSTPPIMYTAEPSYEPGDKPYMGMESPGPYETEAPEVSYSPMMMPMPVVPKTPPMEKPKTTLKRKELMEPIVMYMKGTEASEKEEEEEDDDE